MLRRAQASHSDMSGGTGVYEVTMRRPLDTAERVVARRSDQIGG